MAPLFQVLSWQTPLTKLANKTSIGICLIRIQQYEIGKAGPETIIKSSCAVVGFSCKRYL